VTNIGKPEPVRHVPKPTTPDSPAEIPTTVPAPSEPAGPPPAREPAPAGLSRFAAG
jgi:hypothetical protein